MRISIFKKGSHGKKVSTVLNLFSDFLTNSDSPRAKCLRKGIEYIYDMLTKKNPVHLKQPNTLHGHGS